MKIFGIHTLVAVALHLHCSALGVFRSCGGFLSSPKGVIQSPNFPNEFPTPVLCEWVIYNQQTRFTLVHFTQFYLTSHFTVQYFQEYTNREMYRNESKLMTMNAYHDVYSLVIPAPYTVLRFGVHEKGDINIRVLERMMDVYGFNITYEFVNSTAEYNKETCTAYHCSYLGNCLASEDFTEYKCHCFDNYFGEFCHYGPDCNLHTKTNMCNNVGTCSYLNGSLNHICECPTGYTGDLCEIKQDACHYLNCEQLCVDVFPGVKGCQCEDGYQLSSDGKSCDIRAHVIVKIHLDFDIHPDSTRWMKLNISNYIARKLRTHHIKIITNITQHMESSLGSKGIELVFVIRNSDRNSTEELMRKIQSEIKEKKDAKLKLTFSFSEELQIKDLVSTTGGAKNRGHVNENEFLTISCIVKGGNFTKFRWYKDGMLIDFSISPRGGYVTTLISDSEGIIRSILYYARVKKYDQGYFSCVASDGYVEKRRSIFVTVQTTPHIHIPSRQMVVSVNDSVRIPCFSINEPYNSFKYEWFENGAPINWHTSNRVIESLLPAGTQLFAKEIKESTNFSCRVSNKVGDVNVTAHVLVAKGQQLVCYADLYMGLLWPKTENGHFTKQMCPPSFGGHVLRSCNCDVKGDCSWDEPSFLFCQSNELIKIYDKMEVLRQGYRSSNISQIYADLHNFVNRKNGTLHVGDAELVISVLRRISEYLWKFPMLKIADENISLADIIGIMDCILTVTRDLPLEIKQKLTLGSNVLHISAFLAQTAFKKLFNVETSEEIRAKNIDITEFRRQENMSSTLNGIEMTTFTFRNLESHLSAKSLFVRPTGVVLSDLVAVYSDFSASPSIDHLSTDISININVQTTSKKIECLSWTGSERTSNFWSNRSCSLISAIKGIVTCHCGIPIEVIVVGHDLNTTNNYVKLDSEASVPVILSYITSICGLLVCLIIYAANWRYLRGQKYVFYTNFILAMLLNNIFLFVCYSRRNDQIFWIVGEIAVYFLYMSMFTCLLFEIFQFFVQTLTSQEYRINKRCSRFIIIGWGIPLVLTIFFSVATVSFPTYSHQQKGMICWISKSSWQLYVFMLPVSVIILVFLIFMVVIWNIRVKLTEESEALFKRHLRLVFMKSLMLLIFTLSESVLGMDLSRTHSNQVVWHFVCKICLIFCIFATRVAFESNIKHCAIQPHFSKKNFCENKRWRWIQGFLCSFKYGKTRSEIEARNYYDAVNKTKYTNERKRELSSLLGTATGYGVRKTRADSSGTTSSRTTDTSVNTSITNVSSDREDVSVTMGSHVTPWTRTGEMFPKEKLLPRAETREEEYFAMYNFPPKDKELASVDGSKEYLSMKPVRKGNIKREGVSFYNFQNIPEVVELHEAIIH